MYKPRGIEFQQTETKYIWTDCFESYVSFEIKNGQDINKLAIEAMLILDYTFPSAKKKFYLR